MEGITFSKTKKDRTPWGLVQTVLVYRDGEEIGTLYKESPEMPEFYADATLESYYGEEFCHGNLRECKKAVVEAHKANPTAEESIPNHDYDDEPDKPEPEAQAEATPEPEPEAQQAAQPVQAEPEVQAEATPEPDKTDERIAELERQVAKYKDRATTWKDLYHGLEAAEHTWQRRYNALAEKTGLEAEATDAIAPDTPWPDKQRLQLDRLLKHLADEANDAQLSAMYAPTDWAADRYEALVQSLHRQASQAKKQGPGEGPTPKPEPDKPVCGGVFIPPHLL